jgi:hypothetical protein
MEVKPLFSLLAAKAAIVNQLHGLSVCFASFNMVTPLWKEVGDVLRMLLWMNCLTIVGAVFSLSGK